MSRTTPSTDDTLLDRVSSWLVARDEHGGNRAMLSKGDLQSLAFDLGITQADLLTAPPDSPDHRELMDQMIRAYGLDPHVIRDLPPPLVRDLRETCGQCSNARRCRRDLKAGTAAVNSPAYCGNATAFDAMIDARKQG